MKYLAIRSQLVFVSVILLLIFVMMMGIVSRYNLRWDFTKEKVFSLNEQTEKILKEMAKEPVEVDAFYPQDDPSRSNFELFLKQCRLSHPSFRFNFYDPDRAPNIAKERNVKQQYTVVIRYRNGVERVIEPTEQSFTNALYRLLQPRKIEACFVTGHGEASLSRQERNGYLDFQEILKANNYQIHEIILTRDHVPSQCHVVVAGGPHRDFDGGELGMLEEAFRAGKGILFLIDPMDPGTGQIFRAFFKKFGVVIGEDVIVDKVSRMVGGDFLVPLISQYVIHHPITENFEKPTFFPVARSVQAAVDLPTGLEAIVLATTGAGSWSETNLQELENGNAVFESESDVLGPISVAVAVEQPGKEGRMVVVGDSDFLTNAYLDLSGNSELALNALQWLAKDDRFISIRPRAQEFKPLLLNASQKWTLVMFTVVAVPLFILAGGLATLFLRARNA